MAATPSVETLKAGWNAAKQVQTELEEFVKKSAPKGTTGKLQTILSKLNKTALIIDQLQRIVNKSNPRDDVVYLDGTDPYNRANVQLVNNYHTDMVQAAKAAELEAANAQKAAQNMQRAAKRKATTDRGG